MQQDERWSRTPKPHVDFPTPTSDLGGAQLVARSQQWMRHRPPGAGRPTRRASSRSFSARKDQTGINGITLAHHDASHHGQEPTKLEQLAQIEEAEIRVFGDFLRQLKTHHEGEHDLLDRTIVFYTSNLGN